MKNISRRDFTRALGLSIFLPASESPSKINLEMDWDAAIEENNLREEISGLMKQTNYSVSYEVNLTPESITHKDIPVDKLYKIRDDLKRYNFLRGRGHIHYNFSK